MTAADPHPNTLVLVGNDRFGRILAGKAASIPGLSLAVDRSLTIGRVLRLLIRGRIPLRRLWLMIVGELKGRTRDVPDWPDGMIGIAGNQDLLRLIAEHDFRRVLLFRAGLIINRGVLDSGAEILNIHCARLPDYGGLDSIGRALDDGNLDQCATLYRVTEKIDNGEIIRERSFRLNDRGATFEQNEQRAYEAGILLAIEFLTEGAR